MRILSIATLLVFSLAAQTDRAAFTGVVMDPSRSVVPAAKVNCTRLPPGLTYAGLTNSAGVYTFSGLPVGQYSVSIVAAGFESLANSDLHPGSG